MAITEGWWIWTVGGGRKGDVDGQDAGGPTKHAEKNMLNAYALFLGAAPLETTLELESMKKQSSNLPMKTWNMYI